MGGASIQLWQSPEDGEMTLPCTDTLKSQGGLTLGNLEADDPDWECIWNCTIASPVYHLCFSPDGLLFASASKVC